VSTTRPVSLALLQGKWKVISLAASDRNGVKHEDSEWARKFPAIRIKGDRWWVLYGDGSEASGEFRVAIGSGNPATINISCKSIGLCEMGLIRRQGDMIQILSVQHRENRPTSFEDSAGCYLLILQRVR
jgi:uncharacterized protein (TIGR03067 family)